MHCKTNIDNSYESEPSSCSASPSCDSNSSESKNTSVDIGIPIKLSELLKPTILKQSTEELLTEKIGITNLQKHAANSIEFKIHEMKNSNCSENSKLNQIKSQDKMNEVKNSDLLQSSLNAKSEFRGFSMSEIFGKKIEYVGKEEKVEENYDDSLDENSPSPGRLLIDEGSLFPSNSNNENQKSKDAKSIILQETKSNLEVMNQRSPDLFDFDDDETDLCNAGYGGGINADIINDETTTTTTHEKTSSSIMQQAKEIRNSDMELLKRIKHCLSGVPPPPSVTISQIDILNTVLQNKENILNFYTEFKEIALTTPTPETVTNNSNDQKKSTNLFKPTHSLQEIEKISWPEILNVKQHGLCYNVSTVREKIEFLCMSVVERYVGVETSSTCQSFPLNDKKSTAKSRKAIQSPGSRLSHLARRRAVFSSATLQSTFQKQIPKNITARQILIDTKKSDNRRKSKIKTPKRKTPGKTKIARKPPSSSAKKSLQFKENVVKPNAPTRETSKRALFQSPPSETLKAATTNVPKPITIKPEIANRIEKSKRALFSPEKPLLKSSINNENELKRKRESTSDEGHNNNPTKISRIESFDNLTPRSLKFKSQSFCIGAGTSNSSNSDTHIKGKPLFRASSDTVCSSQLTESHRKKLLWAVSQALQTRQIGIDHPKFRQYATVLARAIKRLFLEFYLNIKNTSTSETMLRLSKKYVHCALSEMTADDIYFNEKNRRIELEKQLLSKKLTGYIAPEDYENYNNSNKLKKIPSAIFSDNSCDSFNLLSQNYYGTQNLSVSSSQYSELMNHLSQDSLLSKSNNSNTNDGKFSAIKLQNFENINKISSTIISSTSSPPSSSKSNLYGVALRENVDCEQRKSAQKNFTGKDLKNTSPFIEQIIAGTTGSDLKYRNLASIANNHQNKSDLNTIKAKRQISFDN